MALNVKPYSEKHAIKNVVFALEFSAPVQSDFLQSIRVGSINEQLQKELPRVIEQKALVFNFANAGTNLNLPAAGSPQPLGGLSYDRLRPNGEAEWAVVINQTMLLITCGAYSRWAGIWPTVKNFLLLMLPEILKVTSIGTLGLQYVDEFSSTGPKDRFSLHEIFAKDSRFLPPNLINLQDQCHSHHGFFEKLDTPVAGKILTNINVDVVEQPSRWVASVTGSHRYMLGTPIDGQQADSLLNDEGIATQIWAKLHQCNKLVVGDMLTSEVKELISFDHTKKN
ncbi:TIGR04255 family protein [Burkholderia pseudomallei]|uniref:TIGR04255 family protein n=1 Tax=Burkholderia pseudomallei TaxID=28450 RepID=UPI000A1A04A0|nr:TIGR04255 family protein [Burkholderia pseudomallei]ARL98128.1 hypothetical protein BOC58_36760 [Burkholderia pseudomallei]